MFQLAMFTPKGLLKPPGIYARHETVQAGKKLQLIEDIEISKPQKNIS
jgi:hypothetical protein